MSDQLLGRLREINPETDENVTPDDLAALFSMIDDRRAVMDTTTQHPRRTELDTKLRRWRPTLAFAASTVVALLVIGSAALLTRSSDGDVGDGPATTVAPVVSEAPPTTGAVTGAGAVEFTWRIVGPSQVESRAVFGGQLNFNALATGNARLVAVGGVAASEIDETPAKAAVWISNDDGAAWEEIINPSFFPEPGKDSTSTSAGIAAVASGSDGFIAAGQLNNDAAIWRSPDGETWTGVESPSLEGPGLQEISGIVAGGPGWVAVGRSELEGRIWVSEDGTSWEVIDNRDFAGISFREISADGQRLVALAGANARPDEEIVSLTWVSTNGIDWEPTPQSTEIGPETHSISMNPADRSLLALSRDGVWSSADGTTWTELLRSNGTPPYTHPTNGAVWLGERVIAIHPEVGLFTSVDGGSTWDRIGPTDSWIGTLIEHDGQLIALGNTIWIGTSGAE